MKQIRFVYQDQRGIHYDKLAKIILPPPSPFQIQNGCDMRTVKDALHILQQREIPRRLWKIENNQCKALFTISHFEMANQRGPFYTLFESDLIALAVSPDEDYIVVTKRDYEEEEICGGSSTAVAVPPVTSVAAVPTNNTTAAVGKNASTGNLSDIASTRNTSTASSEASNSVETRQAVTGNFVTPQKTSETQTATASAKTQTMNANMNKNDSTARPRQPEPTKEKEKQDVNSQTSPYTYAQQEITAKRKTIEETEKTTPSKKKKLRTTPRPTPPRKWKPPKDPKKPKHPKSAYLFFTMKQRSQLKDKISVTEIGKRFGKAWKKLSNVEKAPFELMSHVEWIKYRKAMKDYQPSTEYLENVEKYETFKQKYNVRLKEYKEALKMYELEKKEYEKESENVERQDIVQVETVLEKETVEECTVMNIDSVTNEHDSVQNQEIENQMEQDDQEDDNEDDSQIIVILNSDSDSDESVFVHCSPQAQRVPDMIYATHLKNENELDKKQSSSQHADESNSKKNINDSVRAAMVDKDMAAAKDEAANNSSKMSSNETSTSSNEKKQKQPSSSKAEDQDSDLVIGERYFILTKKNEETLVELKEIDEKTNNVVVRMLGNKFSRTLCRDELLEYTEERREKYDNRVNETKGGKSKGSEMSITRKLKLVIGEKYFVQLSKKIPTAVMLVSLNDTNGTAEIQTLRNFKSKHVKQSKIMEYTPELEEKSVRGSRVANKKSNEESNDKRSEKSSPQSSPKKSKEKPKASDGKSKTKAKENEKDYLLTEDVKQKLMLQLRKRARVNPKDIWPLLFGPRLNSKNIPEYQSKKCIVQEEEERRIYYASKDETVKSIAKHYDIDVNQILYNNSSREGFTKLTVTTKLKKNEGIILPIVKGVNI